MSAKKYLNEERAAELIDQIERRSPANFVGTTAQWNALTASQKAKYAIVDLVDDGETLGIDPVDAVTDGDMRAVTSNAVFDKVGETVSFSDNYDYYAQHGGGLVWNQEKAEKFCDNMVSRFGQTNHVEGNVKLMNGCTYFGHYIYVWSSYPYISVLLHSYMDNSLYRIVKDNQSVRVFKVTETAV